LKKAKTIFLLIIIIVPFWGFYLFFKAEIKQVRKQVKRQIIAGMTKEDLCLLKFSKIEVNKYLKWKHSKEFEFDHYMYDIVFADSTNDSIFYWCWKDVRETELANNLDILMLQSMQKQNPQNKKTNKVIEFYKNLFIPANKNQYSKITEFRKNLFFYKLIEYSTFEIIPPDPPPKTPCC